MEEKKFSTISPGKAIIGFIFDVLLLIVGPIYLTEYLNTNYPAYGAYITPDILNMILTLGVFSAITVFFKNLWKPGTRPHGFFNIIFAAYHTYYIFNLFGGFAAFDAGNLGIFEIAISGISIAVNVSLLAYVFMAQGIIAIILYFFEMIL